MVVVVTGANGQLGQSIQFIANNYPEIHFIFCDSATLDITNIDSCNLIFATYKPDFCINAAAYTAVDRAETEPEKAFEVNVLGAKNLAEVCKTHDTVLLHVSTDFVFDGKKTTPYTEQDTPHPTGVYGQTKREGEQAIEQTWEKHYIVRTSWVYSQFGANFMKTMLRLASERDSLSVVSDQIGTPTNAVDLAEALLTIIQSSITHHPSLTTFGIYNFSNEGQCSWYDFAAAIFKQKELKMDLKPIPTSAYPTPASRPAYSVLDKTKIKNTFNIEVNEWKTSLVRGINLL